MSCEDTVHVSFLHKCSQFSWCSALNVKVAVTFLDISSFHCIHGSVIFFGAPLSGTIDYLKYSRDASAPRDPRFICRFSFLPRSSCLRAHGSLIILGSLIIVKQGP